MANLYDPADSADPRDMIFSGGNWLKIDMRIMVMFLRAVGNSFAFTEDDLEAINTAESVIFAERIKAPHPSSASYILILKETDDQGSV